MSFIRPVLGAVATMLLCAAPNLYADEVKNSFAISDAQMRALGIELVTLSRQHCGCAFSRPSYFATITGICGQCASCRISYPSFGAREPASTRGYAAVGAQ